MSIKWSSAESTIQSKPRLCVANYPIKLLEFKNKSRILTTKKHYYNFVINSLGDTF